MSDHQEAFEIEKRKKFYEGFREDLGLREIPFHLIRDDDIVLVNDPDDTNQLLVGVVIDQKLYSFLETTTKVVRDLSSTDDALLLGHVTQEFRNGTLPTTEITDALVRALRSRIEGSPNVTMEAVRGPSSIHKEDLLYLTESGYLVLRLASQLETYKGEPEGKAEAIGIPENRALNRIRFYDLDTAGLYYQTSTHSI